jgi:hypothetical protein
MAGKACKGKTEADDDIRKLQSEKSLRTLSPECLGLVCNASFTWAGLQWRSLLANMHETIGKVF